MFPWQDKMPMNLLINGMIWNRLPNATHVGINMLSLDVYDAIAHFNCGTKVTLDLYDLDM